MSLFEYLPSGPPMIGVLARTTGSSRDGTTTSATGSAKPDGADVADPTGSSADCASLTDYFRFLVFSSVATSDASA